MRGVVGDTSSCSRTVAMRRVVHRSFENPYARAPARESRHALALPRRQLPRAPRCRFCRQAFGTSAAQRLTPLPHGADRRPTIRATADSVPPPSSNRIAPPPTPAPTRPGLPCGLMGSCTTVGLRSLLMQRSIREDCPPRYPSHVGPFCEVDGSEVATRRQVDLPIEFVPST